MVQSGDESAGRAEQWAQDQLARGRNDGRSDCQTAAEWVKQLQATADRLKQRISELDSELQAEHSTVQVSPCTESCHAHAPGWHCSVDWPVLQLAVRAAA